MNIYCHWIFLVNEYFWLMNIFGLWIFLVCEYFWSMNIFGLWIFLVYEYFHQFWCWSSQPVAAVSEGCSACEVISPSNLYCDDELWLDFEYQSYWCLNTCKCIYIYVCVTQRISSVLHIEIVMMNWELAIIRFEVTKSQSHSRKIKAHQIWKNGFRNTEKLSGVGVHCTHHLR